MSPMTKTLASLFLTIILSLFAAGSANASACDTLTPQQCGYYRTCTLVDGQCTTNPYFQPSVPTSVSQFFENWNLNSIKIKNSLLSPDDIINALIPLLIVIAGVILLLMLILGGFQMLTSAANPDQAEAGKKRITTALAGFLIIFVSYWLIQILEILLGINILGTTP